MTVETRNEGGKCEDDLGRLTEFEPTEGSKSAVPR